MNVVGTNIMSENVSRYSANTYKRKNITQKNSFSKGISLKMNDSETGRKALTSVGFPDGSTVSVFEANDSSKMLTKYDVKYWSKTGEEDNYIIEPIKVNPEYASYIDMLAYSTFLDKSGKTKNAFGDFISASRGIDGNIQYNSNNIDNKNNFLLLVQEFMNQQYKVGNMAGYLSSKSFFDCMRMDDIGK